MTDLLLAVTLSTKLPDETTIYGFITSQKLITGEVLHCAGWDAQVHVDEVVDAGAVDGDVAGEARARDGQDAVLEPDLGVGWGWALFVALHAYCYWLGIT